MLIFHSPLSVSDDRISGSGIRPLALYKAFQEIGVDVTLVDGSSRERRKKWDSISHSCQNIYGVYSELSTTPIALTDKDHIPRSPFMDFIYFSKFRRRGIPVSAFYRDVYWRFHNYSKIVPLYKRIPALLFYQMEAWQLSRCADHIFLPSMEMRKYIPFIIDTSHTSALPPGGQVREFHRIKRSGPLELFYVGGVGGEQYDISPMLKVVESMDGVRLTLCCREQEWRAIRGHYGSLRNVKVVHHSGQQLDLLFQSADIFLMWWRMVDYLRFAMPVKLGEAVGWGIPVITNANCEMGDFVNREKFGWTPSTEEELRDLILYLRDHRDEVVAGQVRVMEGRAKHSWRVRAETIMSTLGSYRTKAR